MRVFEWGSIPQDKNLEEPKDGALGRGLVPLGERFMGLGNTSKESLYEKLGLLLRDQKSRSLWNQKLQIGSLLGVRF